MNGGLFGSGIPTQKPWVGASVHYHDPRVGIPWAAIVTEVIPAGDGAEVELVNLVAFPPGEPDEPIDNVPESKSRGDGDVHPERRTWSWPAQR